MLKFFSHKYTPYLLLFLLVVGSYYSISFFQYPFKWDMVDQYFPWRYLVSEHLHTWQLPLWNPYQNGGYPMHGDPQSAAWYPVVWVLSFLTGGYTIYTLHIEFILTLYIAAIGFYKLAKEFQYSSHTAILLAYTYCCSGFFIGNAQHFTWIISGAFLPFVFYYFIKTLKTPSLESSIKTALSLFFILSGGYPAFLIIVAYILFALLIIKLFELLKEKKYRQTLRLLLYQVYITIAFILLSAVVLYSIIDCKPLITRGDSVSLEAALFMPFSLQSFISFVFPFATCHHSEIIHTDISMANVYTGLVGFFFFILSCFRKNKTGLQKTCLTIGIFCLLASVGSALPVRTWLYNYFPLMNLFRFPSAFRIFFLISFLLLAGSELDKIIGKHVISAHVKYLYVLATLFICSILGLAILKNYSGTGFKDYIFNTAFFNDHCTVYDHILIQGSIHLLLLVTMFVLYLRYSKNIFAVKWALTCFIISDLLIAVNLNMKYTALNEHSRPKDIATMLAQSPQGFPIPSVNVTLNNDNIQDFKPFWKNLNIFRKEIAYDGYNPFFLINYAKLERSNLYKISQDNAPFFLADNISNIESFIDTINIPDQQVYLSPQDYLKYRQYKPNSLDDKLNVLTYTGNTISILTTTKTPRLVVMYQNYTPGWKAYINSTETPILQANHALIALPVPKGINKIDFTYDPVYIDLFFIISAISILLATVFTVYSKLIAK